MAFNKKTWVNPVILDATNLNRIEQGVQDSTDILNILKDEVANLQTNQSNITKSLNELLEDSPTILSTIKEISSLLEDDSIMATLNNTNNLLTKSSQNLSKDELNQVYKNLGMDKFLKLTSIRVNDENVVSGSEVNITLPTIDTTLNIHSNNAIANSVVAKALKNVTVDVDVPTSLADLQQTSEYQTVSAAEKKKWNSMTSGIATIEFTETDPTVPAWAKESTKPFYTYSEILDTPNIPTDNVELANGAGYITSAQATTITNKLLSTFKINTITPIQNDIASLQNTTSILSSELQSHKHDTVYSKLGHTHDEYKTYTDTAIANLVASAPETLDTLKELADAITENDSLLEALTSTVANHNHDSTYSKLSHNHDSVYSKLSHTHNYSAVYTGLSATQSSNTTLSTLRLGYINNSLYIWNS